MKFLGPNYYDTGNGVVQYITSQEEWDLAMGLTEKNKKEKELVIQRACDCGSVKVGELGHFDWCSSNDKL